MNLKDIRLAKGLTQKAVADYLGCSSVVYSRYETGDREPSIDMMIRIADYFDMALDDIVGRTKPDESSLSAYDRALLTAAHNADERARQDALHMLTTHSEEGKKEKLA